MKMKYLSYSVFDIIPIRLTLSNAPSNFCLLICFLSIFISNYTFCQKLSPEVISSAGDISKTASILLEWTLGETVIESSKTVDKYYTQGFHQTYLKVTSILPTDKENLSSDYSMMIFPNPVEAILEVKISTENLLQNETGKVDLLLFNLVGQQLSVQKTNEKSGSTFVDMTAFPSGTYFLKAQKENGVLLKSFKIIKIR
jgi:Secretion system C-terminal sorting domain